MPTRVNMAQLAESHLNHLIPSVGSCQCPKNLIAFASSRLYLQLSRYQRPWNRRMKACAGVRNTFPGSAHRENRCELVCHLWKLSFEVMQVSEFHNLSSRERIYRMFHVILRLLSFSRFGSLSCIGNAIIPIQLRHFFRQKWNLTSSKPSVR
jgi:hypothetical protein